MVQRISLFDVILYVLLFLITLTFIYPFVYLFFTSISSERAITTWVVMYRPKDVSFRAYASVFENPKLMRAYWNSIRYAALSTVFMLAITGIVAYPLAQRRLKFRKTITFFIVLTMFVEGGMIPTYLLYHRLGLVNSIMIMVLPLGLNVTNLLVFKTYFQYMVSEEMLEAAYVDGANDAQALFSIVLPLSKPLLATFGLFHIVAVWNNFLLPLLYLHDEDLQPLTILIRRMIRQQSRGLAAFRAASFFVTILPIALTYPFLQRYFIKGIMIGSLKG